MLAIVAARQGSKRLPNKNILDFNGLPLIVHTLDAINDSGAIAKTIISTDSSEIEAIAAKRGFRNIHHRDEVLCGDTSIVYDTVRDAIRKQTEKYDYVMLLSPTNPLRKFSHIQEAVNIAYEKDADFVSSLTPCTPIEYHGHIWTDGSIQNFLLDQNYGKRVQDFKQTYRLSASIYLAKSGWWLKGCNLYATPRAYPIIIDYDIDIDTIEDFRIAEELEKRRSAKWTD